MGIAGAMRCDELVHMTTDDIEDVKSALLVKIPNSKTKKTRSFTIMGENYLCICRKYIALRPDNFEQRRFFVKYQNGTCHRSVVGIHKLGSVAGEVAKYLNLPNANAYTGHCLRRTSATLLVDSGGDITALKRHGGWRSNTVAEGYIEESIKNKEEIARKILRPDEPSTSNHAINVSSATNDDVNKKEIAQEKCPQDSSTSAAFTDIVDKAGLINVYKNCSNCTFNINVNK